MKRTTIGLLMLGGAFVGGYWIAKHRCNCGGH